MINARYMDESFQNRAGEWRKFMNDGITLLDRLFGIDPNLIFGVDILLSYPLVSVIVHKNKYQKDSTIFLKQLRV
jgi:hypothetical protein